MNVVAWGLTRAKSVALDLRWATSKMRPLFTTLQGPPAWLKCVVLGEGDDAIGWDESGASEAGGPSVGRTDPGSQFSTRVVYGWDPSILLPHTWEGRG